jgi:hypothetical protein
MAATTEKSAPATAIRPFTVEIPQAEIEELGARIAATRWPEKETVADQSQGVQLATMQALVRYWATDYDFRRFESRLNAVPAVHDGDRRSRHPFHPRSLTARGRVAAHHHARLARLRDRDAQRRGPAHRPDGARRRCGGRLRPRDPFVLVHGAFADASSWNGVIERLQGAKITEVEGSHVIMVSQPQAVADVILKAVAAVGSASEQFVGSASGGGAR